MGEVFDYRVCTAQHGRVTFVDGTWQGQRPLDADRQEESLATCPEVWQYLQQAGSEGWELVSAVTRFHVKREGASFLDVLIGDGDPAAEYLFYDTLYLKRKQP